MLENILKTLYITTTDFLNSIPFTVINKDSKGGVVQISTVFVAPYMSLPEGSSENGLFRYFFNHVFRIK